MGSQGASILPVLHDALGEWGAHTLRNVTYLTRDLTHEGGGHQHLNKPAFNGGGGDGGGGSSGSNAAVSGTVNVFSVAAAGDQVRLSSNSPQHKQQQQQSNKALQQDFYDLSFLGQLGEEDKVPYVLCVACSHHLLLSPRTFLSR